MPLVNLDAVLRDAHTKKYAVGLFNTINLEMARGVLQAAEDMRAPVIIGTAEVLLPYAPLRELLYLLLPMARDASVPVVVHLDHGLTKETCLMALALGCTSIMYDCSTAPYEENVRRVKEMADAAHAQGATIEGELGHVGNNAGSEEGSAQDAAAQFFTDPAQARDYAARTGVDALAIAVGNAHGVYPFPPKLDFDRIKEIAQAVPVPLVLHGGSGLLDADFRRAIQCGVCKVNIFTDINAAASGAAAQTLKAGGQGLTQLIPPMVEAVRTETIKKMELFGCANQQIGAKQ